MSERGVAWINIALGAITVIFLATTGGWRDSKSLAATCFVFLAASTILGIVVDRFRVDKNDG